MRWSTLSNAVFKSSKVTWISFALFCFYTLISSIKETLASVVLWFDLNRNWLTFCILNVAIYFLSLSKVCNSNILPMMGNNVMALLFSGVLLSPSLWSGVMDAILKKTSESFPPQNIC